MAQQHASQPSTSSASQTAQYPTGSGIVAPMDCWNTAVSGWEEATLIKNKIGLIVNQRYQILQSIASGSYGAIFVGEDLWSESRRRVAVKFDAACRDDHLKYEFDVYKSVLYDDGTGRVEGFPRVYWYGHQYGHNILVMELLGAPLASLFAFCDRRFGRETIVSLGVQMIERIRHLHRRGFIHRDVKPENFLMGLDERESTCYLIDFGLARRYRFRENRDLRHIPFRRGRSFVGTAKYASLNGHKGIELSRRDDLESLGYVLVELVNGHLPWKHISKRNTAYTRHQTSMKIRAMKEQASWTDLCPSMAPFIAYCRQLPFLDDPDYDVLLELVKKIEVVDCPLKPNPPETLTASVPIKTRCESCDALIKHSAGMSPTAVTEELKGTVIISSPIAGISSGNVLCRIPYTLIKPVEDCVASLRSLSIAAAAAATSVNAAVSIPSTASVSGPIARVLPAGTIFTTSAMAPLPLQASTTNRSTFIPIKANKMEELEDEEDGSSSMTSAPPDPTIQNVLLKDELMQKSPKNDSLMMRNNSELIWDRRTQRNKLNEKKPNRSYIRPTRIFDALKFSGGDQLEEIENKENDEEDTDSIKSCRRCRRSKDLLKIPKEDRYCLRTLETETSDSNTNSQGPSACQGSSEALENISIKEMKELKEEEDQRNHHFESVKILTTLEEMGKSNEERQNGGSNFCNENQECQKMCWQVWRDSTLDRRFQYENRFSWTLAKKLTNKTSPQKSKPTRKKPQQNFFLDGIEYDMTIPPPPIPNSLLSAKAPARRRAKSGVCGISIGSATNALVVQPPQICVDKNANQKTSAGVLTLANNATVFVPTPAATIPIGVGHVGASAIPAAPAPDRTLLPVPPGPGGPASILQSAPFQFRLNPASSVPFQIQAQQWPVQPAAQLSLQAINASNLQAPPPVLGPNIIHQSRTQPAYVPLLMACRFGTLPTQGIEPTPASCQLRYTGLRGLGSISMPNHLVSQFVHTPNPVVSTVSLAPLVPPTVPIQQHQQIQQYPSVPYLNPSYTNAPSLGAFSRFK